MEPDKIALFTILWDMFLLFCWFIYNLVMIDDITVVPLLLNFFYILFMFAIIWDIRDPEGKYKIVKYYNYFRIGTATLMSLFALVMFMLIFVFLADTSLERTIINRYWALGFFLFFTPASFITWGSVFGMRKALKRMQGVTMGGSTGGMKMPN